MPCASGPRHRHGDGCGRRCRERSGAGAARWQRSAADPRRRDRATAEGVHAAGAQGGRIGPAEHPHRHHQRPLVQRVRRRRAAHLRQCRRADGSADAKPDHRRACARDRPHRRRTSGAHPRTARQCVDPDDPRHAAGRGRDDRRRAQRQLRARQCGRRDDPGAAGGDPEFSSSPISAPRKTRPIARR